MTKSDDPPKCEAVRREACDQNKIIVTSLSGDAMRARLDDLARLRIEVFRAWPYLYKGSLDYEREYLERYGQARTGTLIVAEDDGKIVGASTALGLDEEEDFVQAPQNGR